MLVLLYIYFTVWIYYTGYGEKGTGNWCFKDGTISFQDIFALYKKYLKGKSLAIYTDCCYSGQWVVDCAKILDEMGIGACGHQATQQGIYIRVVASCEPTQKAAVESFVVRNGIKFEDDYKTLYFFSSKKLSCFQTTYTCDFTMVMCLQLEGPKAPCRLPDIPSRCSWKWVDIIAVKPKDRPYSRVRLVDNGIDVWHYVLVDKEMLGSFEASCTTNNISQYGFVMTSGWGRIPPDNIVESIEYNGPTYIKIIFVVNVLFL